MKHGKNGSVHRLELPDAQEMERMREEAAVRAQMQAVGAFRGTVSNFANALLAAAVADGTVRLSEADTPTGDRHISEALAFARKLIVAAGRVPPVTREEVAPQEPVTPEA